MRTLTPTEKFVDWAKNQDEKKLSWLAGSALAAALILGSSLGSWIVRALIASSAMLVGYYMYRDGMSLKSSARLWIQIFGSLTAWHLAAIYLGSGWWGLVLMILGFFAWKLYRMRAFVRMWWTWYKSYMKDSYDGKYRSQSFSERLDNAIKGRRR